MSNDVVSLRVLAILALSSQILFSQTISGVADRGTYAGQVNFTVQDEVGYDITAELNGEPVPVGTAYLVDRMDFYQLVATRTPTGGGVTTSNVVRFIVISSNRGSPEKGLIEWTPHPLTPSAGSEFAGGRLDLIIPQDYPRELEIPVVAWVRDANDHEIRANGTITAAGFEESPIRILRGAGSGFLPAANNPGLLSYPARLQGLSRDKTVNVEAETAWVPISGLLAGDHVWPANSRIHLNGDLGVPTGATLTIREGTVVKIDPLVNITVGGEVSIEGTLERPVILTATNHVLPEVHTHAWGGFLVQGAGASLTAHAAILVGGGGARSWNFGPGSTHRPEQPLLFIHDGASASLTNSAVINTAGQVGNGYNSDVTFDRTLLQRAITAGEYVGGVITLNHAAVIEFPEDNGEVSAAIADADYDAIYFTTGTHLLLNSLIGFCKDDAIDSGSGGAGSVVVSNCWLEAALHEGMAWSGGGRITDTFDTVAINNGQAFECGWSSGDNSPLCYGENMLLLGNAVGARFGDNYDWTYNGRMWVTNSLILNNYRDVWGYNWADWTYRTDQMHVQDNWVTQPNARHPDNAIWNPATDAPRLAPFMTVPQDADVGIAVATWNRQAGYQRLADGVPVRLSTFTTRPVSVNYKIQDTRTAVLAEGTLTFQPGETVHQVPTAGLNPSGEPLLRVSLSEPVNGELTGATTFYFVDDGSMEEPDNTLLARNSVWKYHNLGIDLGTVWREPEFFDTLWPSGPGDLGNGDGGENTVIDIGPEGARYPTIYFRTRFMVEDPSQYESVEIALRRDDGAVVYLNGVEVFRSNMPAGEITYNTFSAGNTGSETAYFTGTGDASLLVPGVNVIAVEVHQDDAVSSDLHFDLGLVGVPPDQATTTLIDRGAVWKYFDLGTDPGAEWNLGSFDDSAWGEGPAELGNGDGNEATMINIGPDGARFPTVYFRKNIIAPDPSLFGQLQFGLRRDDGAVIYLNGTELHRDGNVPANATHDTYATGLTPSETAYEEITTGASALEVGDNLVAVELKQESATSSDLSFDLEMFGAPAPAGPELNVVNFGSDLVFYWNDEAFGMEQAEALDGPWRAVPGGSPMEIRPDQPQQFFRLRGF